MNAAASLEAEIWMLKQDSVLVSQQDFTTTWLNLEPSAAPESLNTPKAISLDGMWGNILCLFQVG